MKSVRVAIALLLVVCLGIITFKSDYLIQLGLVSLNFGWMLSYLFPKVLVLTIASVLIAVVWPMIRLSGGYRFLIGFLILGLSAGGYLLVNIPYVEWGKTGTDMTDEMAGNPIESYLNLNHPGFDGVVCLALPSCSHCEVAVPKLALVKKRVPDLDVLVFVFTDDSSRVGSFQKNTGVENLPFVLAPDPANSSVLCQGSFPGFLYFKNGKVVHRWFNSEFGYAALDWVESGLQ
ncbi:MAG: hypothetical protein K9G41_09580 [Flavobacteriales bacterium]|nr:hypothetical protein [Flavobacteriales bacterium]